MTKETPFGPQQDERGKATSVMTSSNVTGEMLSGLTRFLYALRYLKTRELDAPLGAQTGSHTVLSSRAIASSSWIRFPDSSTKKSKETLDDVGAVALICLLNCLVEYT